jgi:DNA-binding transcriptional MerR regulator
MSLEDTSYYSSHYPQEQEQQQQDCILDLSVSIENIKKLLEDDSTEAQAFISNFLSQLPAQKYILLQENSALFLDADLLSLFCQKGPSLIEPRTFVNFMTLFAFIGMFLFFF